MNLTDKHASWLREEEKRDPVFAQKWRRLLEKMDRLTDETEHSCRYDFPGANGEPSQ